MTVIEYSIEKNISPDQFIDILNRSTLCERRPIDDHDCIKGMVENGNLTVTAWSDNLLVGVARSLTDFHYACYLSDLAVDKTYQRHGIGKTLMLKTQEQLGPKCSLILLSAPGATEYYPKAGFTKHDSAWILRRNQSITSS